MSYTWSVRGPRIKVRILEPELARSNSGIYLTADLVDKEDLQMGEVVAIGSTAYAAEDDAWVSVGDVVMFQRYQGKPITEDKELYRFLKDIDVIAVRQTLEEKEQCQ